MSKLTFRTVTHLVKLCEKHQLKTLELDGIKIERFIPTRVSPEVKPGTKTRVPDSKPEYESVSDMDSEIMAQLKSKIGGI